MKPQGWDEFLKQIAKDYEIHGKLKEIFLVRFAYENWRLADKEVWELAEAASHETYKKQMTEVYKYFSQDKPNGCPELEIGSKGPGKFQILREWFREVKYVEWRQTATANRDAINFSLPNLKDTGIYIQRPPIETDCFQEVHKLGALLRIKAPEKMGKTTLLKKILSYGETGDFHTVYLNLQAAEGAMFVTLDKFLRWFCANITRELQLKPQLDEYWDEDLFGSLVSCQTYFQSYLLEQLAKPLILGVDNLHRVFEYPEIAKDFLPMLRYWHEEAKNVEIWQNLRLVLANSTEAYIQLDVNQSPFNVGRPVRLPGFNLEQMLQLAQQYGLGEEQEIGDFVRSLMDLIDGHPYLGKLAFEAIGQDNLTPEQILQDAATQGGIYGTHLLRHWEDLQKQPDGVTGMKKVLENPTGVHLEPILAYKLEGMGLVTIAGDSVKPSCELYRRYLRDQLKTAP
jgi:hypothetical protein